MKRSLRSSLSVWGLGLALLVSACAPLVGATGDPTAEPSGEDGATPPAAVSHGNPVGGYVDFVDGLRAAGATVEPAGEVTQDFFGPTGQLVKVDGADVQAFEYPDEAAREAESSLITPDGQPNPTTMVTWVDQPNFWAKGRLIVLYVGKDAAVIDVITAVMGEPITQD